MVTEKMLFEFQRYPKNMDIFFMSKLYNVFIVKCFQFEKHRAPKSP